MCHVSVFLRTATEEHKFRGFLLMAEIAGERGHGYFIPAGDSKDKVQAVNCEELPASCEDESLCQAGGLHCREIIMKNELVLFQTAIIKFAHHFKCKVFTPGARVTPMP